MTVKIYRIRNRETGLFSTGGKHPTWSKNGKIWKTLGHVKSHMSQVSHLFIEEYISQSEVIEYEVIEKKSLIVDSESLRYRIKFV